MMKAYSDLLVRTCHRRGAFAIGGMAAFIPSRRDPEVNERAFAKVREDKTREVRAGFDGSWVAHPDLVPLCAEVFDDALAGRDNQLDVARDDVSVAAADLLAVGGHSRRAHRGRACAATSGSACSTSTPGSPATAPPASTTSWRTPPPPRSPARRCGSGSTTARALDTGEVVTRELVERIVDGGARGARRDGRRRRPPAVRRLRARRGLPRLPHPQGVRRPAGARGLTGRTKPPEAICSPPTHTSATSASQARAKILPSADSGESACRRPMSRAVPGGGRSRMRVELLALRQVADGVGQAERGRAGRRCSGGAGAPAPSGIPSAPMRCWRK